MAFMFNLVDHLLPPLAQIDEQMLDLPRRSRLRFESRVRKIILLLEGECVVTIDESTRWHLRPGDALLVDRSCLQAYASLDPARPHRLHVLRLVFDEKTLPARGRTSPESGKRGADTTRSALAFIRHYLGGTDVMRGALTPEIRECLAKIRFESETRPPGFRSAVSSLGVLLVTLLGRQRAKDANATAEGAGSSRPAHVVGLSKAYIAANLAKELKLQDVAWHVGWSTEHFSRVFRSVTGLSPAHYIRQARIEQAKIRLLGTGETVSRIAERTGFSSIAVFSRCFRREVGLTPQAYRERQRFGKVVEDVSADYADVPVRPRSPAPALKR